MYFVYIPGEEPEHEASKDSGRKASEGYVAYPLGLNGVVVGQGGTYEDALADVLRDQVPYRDVRRTGCL